MNTINKIKLFVTVFTAVATLLVFVPTVSADGQVCTGDYGQTVSCGPATSPTPHTPVETGIGDFINPFTVGLMFVGAGGVAHLLNKRQSQAI